MNARLVKLAVSTALAATLLALAAPRDARAYVFISDSGCNPGEGAAWPANMMPGDWYINSAGYSLLPMATVEATFATSMNTWGASCCSNWRHSYLGQTASTPTSNSTRHIVGFEEQTWPSEFGSVNSTIAVTLPVPTFGCQIVSADMLFNAVGFRFRTSGAATDLESIATHEFGHWIGLDHTNANGATMLPFYSGGSDERTLTQDDTNGACALYPRACGGCSVNADCPNGQECAGGACQTITCVGNGDCAAGTICRGGSCVPGCRVQADCPATYSCTNGACQRPAGSCSICDTCAENADCGGASYYCIDLGAAAPQCTKTCNSDADCPGDSSCFQVQDGAGNVYNLCFAPASAGQELCPAGYVCEEPAVNPAGCVGLWDFCSADRSSCNADADTCVQTGNTAKCSCTCTVNADCGAGAQCLRDPTSGQNVCFPDSVIDPCSRVTCGAGQSCVDGTCVSQDPCAGVTCGADETCQNGLCVGPCGTCPAGRVCDVNRRACVFGDACTNVQCPPDRVCVEGQCRFPDPCAGETCPAGQSCVDGSCLPDDPCAGVTCAEGEGCVDGACIPGSVDDCATVGCPVGEGCVSGACQPIGAGCPDGCPVGEGCQNGTCQPIEPGTGGSGTGGGATAEAEGGCMGCASSGGAPLGLALFGLAAALLRRRSRNG